MHMQLAILCLGALGAVATDRNVRGCSLTPCQKHIGVYYINVTLGPNYLISFEVTTLHADGTFSAIDSGEYGDPSSTPPLPPYSSSNGVWKCDGANGVEVNAASFFYPTQGFSGVLTINIAKSQFDGNGRVTGTSIATSYDLSSTKNQDRSKWIKVEGPVEYSLKGYKLYDICDG